MDEKMSNAEALNVDVLRQTLREELASEREEHAGAFSAWLWERADAS